jgi:hemerythrin-like domain-containing protein
MPKVTHVKHAAKDYPAVGIKKGDEYYWWAFQFGPKIMSKTPPKRYQLTRSPFLSELYHFQDEEIPKITAENTDDLQQIIEDMKEKLEEWKNSAEESLENMPEQLRETSEAGINLQERIDHLDSWISDLESIDLDFDKEGDQKLEEWIEEKIAEIQGTDSYF